MNGKDLFETYGTALRHGQYHQLLEALKEKAETLAHLRGAGESAELSAKAWDDLSPWAQKVWEAFAPDFMEAWRLDNEARGVVSSNPFAKPRVTITVHEESQ